MAEMIKNDMYIVPRTVAESDKNPDYQFDPEQFSALKNAVTLAKMTFLSAAQLNSIAGSKLYDENTPEPVNILLGALRSIDGNHQWLATAPSYPRRANFVDKGWPDHRQYGYKYSSAKGGLKLWGECGARDNGFRKVFQGPMNPSFETPVLFPGLPPMLTASNQYDPSVNRPFPSGFWNMDCDSLGIMVSIWSLLN